MNADKTTLAGYIVYLEDMYKRYGNISIAQLERKERNKKKISNQRNKKRQNIILTWQKFIAMV